MTDAEVESRLEALFKAYSSVTVCVRVCVCRKGRGGRPHLA